MKTLEGVNNLNGHVLDTFPKNVLEELPKY